MEDEEMRKVNKTIFIVVHSVHPHFKGKNHFIQHSLWKIDSRQMNIFFILHLVEFIWYILSSRPQDFY